MSGTDLQTIDVQDFKKRVQEHVINTFGSLIPPEQFEAMVNAEIKAFFEQTMSVEITRVQSQSYSYSNNVDSLKTAMTPFRAVVWARVQLLVNDSLRDFFNGDHSPVKKVIDELTRLPELQEQQFSKAQELMLAMAGMMFRNVMVSANEASLAGLVNQFRQNNLHDIANALQSFGIYAPENPEVRPS